MLYVIVELRKLSLIKILEYIDINGCEFNINMVIKNRRI